MMDSSYAWHFWVYFPKIEDNNLQYELLKKLAKRNSSPTKPPQWQIPGAQKGLE